MCLRPVALTLHNRKNNMSHFAKVVNGIVKQVIVADQEFIDTLKDATSWIQTSYNTAGNQHLTGGVPLRKNYAVIGGVYDPITDSFYGVSPYKSWVLNTTSYLWEAPISMPTDGQVYRWQEEEQRWVVKDCEE